MEELRKNLQALLQVLLCFPEYQVISMQELWGGTICYKDGLVGF